MSGVLLRLSGVIAHISLESGERLREPLRRFYRKVMHESTSKLVRTILKVAVKPVNDTVGQNGLISSRHVFGVLPGFPIIITDLPSQKERIEALSTAQAENELNFC